MCVACRACLVLFLSVLSFSCVLFSCVVSCAILGLFLRCSCVVLVCFLCWPCSFLCYCRAAFVLSLVLPSYSAGRAGCRKFFEVQELKLPPVSSMLRLWLLLFVFSPLPFLFLCFLSSLSIDVLLNVSPSIYLSDYLSIWVSINLFFYISFHLLPFRS